MATAKAKQGGYTSFKKGRPGAMKRGRMAEKIASHMRMGKSGMGMRKG